MKEDNGQTVDLIAFDGGPNSGKTTGLSAVAQFLTNNGFAVMTTPEAATEVLGRGFRPDMVDGVFFQEMIAQRIMDNERLFGDIARELAHKAPRKKAIVLCDRGLMSAQAYMAESSRFAQVLAACDQQIEKVLFARYAQVVHLRTTAYGLEELYEQTRSHNPVRTETVEEARIIDQKILDAWSGHRNLAIIDNSYASFDQKIAAAISVVARSYGLPSPANIERKFLMKVGWLPQHAIVVDIEQFYLTPNSYVRILHYYNGVKVYCHVDKKGMSQAHRVRTEHLISREQFTELLIAYATQVVPCVRKRRFYFTRDNLYARVDLIAGIENPILEIQLSCENESLEALQKLPIVREVTDDPRYYNYNIARHVQS